MAHLPCFNLIIKSLRFFWEEIKRWVPKLPFLAGAGLRLITGDAVRKVIIKERTAERAFVLHCF